MKTLMSVGLLILPIALSASGYGVMLAADIRYVQQRAWIQENRASDVRPLQYRLDELEFNETQRNLTPKEEWEKKRLKTEIREIKTN